MSQSQAEKLTLNNVFSLEGRIALVTGGGTGIGLMIAQGLAMNGAKVYISGRRKDVLEKAVSELPKSAKGSLHALQMDVTDKGSILAGVRTIEQLDGKLHVLVNNSGQTGPLSTFFNDMNAPEHKDPGTLGRALFDNEDFSSWSSLYSINTFSIFFTATAFLGLLSKGSEDVRHWQSVVVNVTSISGLMGLAQNHFAYNSAKAAASQLTRLLATEFALKKVPVRVNAIAPGVYATEMTRDKFTDPLNATVEEVAKVSQALVPVPAARPGNAQEMAGTIIYLASPAGAYTNGQEIVIDGGYLAVNP